MVELIIAVSALIVGGPLVVLFGIVGLVLLIRNKGEKKRKGK